MSTSRCVPCCSATPACVSASASLTDHGSGNRKSPTRMFDHPDEVGIIADREMLKSLSSWPDKPAAAAGPASEGRARCGHGAAREVFSGEQGVLCAQWHGHWRSGGLEWHQAGSWLVGWLTARLAVPSRRPVDRSESMRHRGILRLGQGDDRVTLVGRPSRGGASRIARAVTRESMLARCRGGSGVAGWDLPSARARRRVALRDKTDGLKVFSCGISAQRTSS